MLEMLLGEERVAGQADPTRFDGPRRPLLAECAQRLAYGATVLPARFWGGGGLGSPPLASSVVRDARRTVERALHGEVVARVTPR
jgi:hypothetical protein